MARRNHDFQTIRSEGGLLPPDLLRRVIDPKAELDGTTSQDYGLPPGERLNESITQSWNRLRKHWADFRANARNLPEEEAGTGLTNDKWSVPLLRELGFGLLPTSVAPEIGGKTYAINRFFGATAIHLIGCGLSLDRRAAGVRGAAIANPHGLVQDFLNRSDGHLWAILSNGLRLRILRDSQAISRQSYLEFDLEAMFDGEVFSDFVLLWLMAHATRFAAREGERPETCWLEQWTKEAEEQGTRALGDLKQGVEKALEILGQGFVGHPKNTALRDALRTGKLLPADLHGQLLRVVYRLIFLFVAEDRTLDGLPLLHPHDESEAARIARECYHEHYSAGRLRELAGAIRGSRHGDLWWQLNLVVGALSGEERFKAVREQLALPVLGSFLWSPDSTAALNAPSLAATDDAELANADLLEAIRNLAFTRQNHTLRPVDYKNLGAEELGGVYESLLALTPQVSGDGAQFTFAEFAGNERKTSGSYYTPDSLVQCLLDSALDPVVEEAIKGKSGAAAEQAILSLKVCDPAVGSGHFLVGAAHRLARHLARIRAVAQGEGEPSPSFYQHALRDVIGRCLYGVDINPMAAELCRVSLWLEALDPGKPLSFLDHHIRVGNSLLGTTPELIAGGLPDDAFTAIEGDDKKVCTQLKRRNKAEREGFEQRDLLGAADHAVAADLSAVTREASKLDATSDDTVDAVQRKADQFRRLVVSAEYKHAQQVADAWCAAFVWPKTPSTLTDVVTSGTIKRLGTDPRALNAAQVKEVERLSSQYQFFHWHLAFPEVFAKGGFDCVLGNPPWERVKLSEKEFFAGSAPLIANAQSKATRESLIRDLARAPAGSLERQLYEDFHLAKREAEAISAFCHGLRYPLTGTGDVNTYAVFAETAVMLRRASGRAGLILPSGIATDDSTSKYFASVSDGKLVSLYDFENKDGLFESVHRSTKFSLVTLGPALQTQFAFFLTDPAQLSMPYRRFTLQPGDIARLNPNTRTCPVFRTEHDADITRRVYRNTTVLLDETVPDGNPWGVEFRAMFHMSNDSSLFRTSDELEKQRCDRSGQAWMEPTGAKWVRLYEAKMTGLYDHRAGSYATRTEGRGNRVLPESTVAQHEDPTFSVSPYYWVPEKEVVARIPERWSRKWFIGFNDITTVVTERSLLATLVPWAGVGNNLPLLFPLGIASVASLVCLYANLASIPFDYVVRQKVGRLHLNFFIVKQLPVVRPAAVEKMVHFVVPRALELLYSAWDLKPFYEDLMQENPAFDARRDSSRGQPFRWDLDRRAVLRAELDAWYGHAFGLSRDDLRYILDPAEIMGTDYPSETFRVLRERETRELGEYRTRRLVLEAWDRLFG